MSRKCETPNTARNIQLATYLTPEEFEEVAAKAFFCNLPLCQTQTLANDGKWLVTKARKLLLPFRNLREDANGCSAPGKDGITWKMLRNLNEQEKLELLGDINDSI